MGELTHLEDALALLFIDQSRMESSGGSGRDRSRRGEVLYSTEISVRGLREGFLRLKTEFFLFRTSSAPILALPGRRCVDISMLLLICGIEEAVGLDED